MFSKSCQKVAQMFSKSCQKEAQMFSKSCQKSTHSDFSLKDDAFQNIPKVTKYFGFFLENFSKIFYKLANLVPLFVNCISHYVEAMKFY